MSDTDTDPAPAPPADFAGHCRACGYALRGLASNICPECGRAFDPANPRTFARRPPRSALRRWARRGLFLVLAMLTLGGAGVGWLWWDWQSEQVAVKQIRAEEGLMGTKPIGPEWLRARWPGRYDYLFERAHGAQLGSQDTKAVRRVEWGRLKHLTLLTLSGQSLDAGVARQLNRSGRLDQLSLDGSTIDDEAWRAITRFSALTHLGLRYTKTTDARLADLRPMRRLKTLFLCGTPVGDAGLAHIASLPALESLDLQVTKVTDAGLVHLHGHPSLRRVDPRFTPVTPAAVARLRAATPKALVYDPLPNPPPIKPRPKPFPSLEPFFSTHPP